jgi:hypothetical protein
VAIKELQQSGFDMKKLSIAGRDYHTDETVVGYYGDQISAGCKEIKPAVDATAFAVGIHLMSNAVAEGSNFIVRSITPAKARLGRITCRKQK